MSKLDTVLAVGTCHQLVIQAWEETRACSRLTRAGVENAGSKRVGRSTNSASFLKLNSIYRLAAFINLNKMLMNKSGTCFDLQTTLLHFSLCKDVEVGQKANINSMMCSSC